MDNKKAIEQFLQVSTAVIVNRDPDNIRYELTFIHASIGYDRQNHIITVKSETEEDLPVIPDGLSPFKREAWTKILVLADMLKGTVSLIKEQQHIKLQNVALKIDLNSSAFFPTLHTVPIEEIYILTEDVSAFRQLPESLTMKEFLNSPDSLRSQRPVMIWHEEEAIYKDYEVDIPTVFISRHEEDKPDKR